MKKIFARFKEDWRNIIPEILLGWFLGMNQPQIFSSVPIISYVLFGFGAFFWLLGLSRLSVKWSWFFTLAPLTIPWMHLPLTGRILVFGPILLMILLAIIFRNKQEWRLINWIYTYLQDWYYKVLWQFPSYRTLWYKKYEQKQEEEHRLLHEKERLQQEEERRRLYEKERLQQEEELQKKRLQSEKERLQWEERQREREKARIEREASKNMSPYAQLGLSENATLKDIKSAWKRLRGEEKQLLQVAEAEKNADEIKRINIRIGDIEKAFNKLTDQKKKNKE